MAFPTVTIGGNVYEVYADLPTANEYLAAQISAESWRAATDDTKCMALVSQTRLFDRQAWQGEPAAAGQPHAFPRTGLTYPDGSPVDPTTVPQQMSDACCEGAAALIDGAATQDTASTDNTTRILKAGSVLIEYFRTVPVDLRFPLPVQELIGFWLAGAAGALALSQASGVDGCSEFKRDPDFSQGF